MLLKELGRGRKIVINYYKDGFYESCKGHVQKLNLLDQTIDLKDEKENIFQIPLAWIYDVTSATL